MFAWFVNHVLPGLITAAIIGLSHFRLKRHVSKVADAQTKALKGSDEGETDDRQANR